MRVMRWRNGALSVSDLAKEPGLGRSRTYQPDEMPLPSKHKPGLRRIHQEMNSEAASSSSPLRIAVPPKRARVEQGVQRNQTMQDLDGMKDELERIKMELDEMTKTMLITQEDRDMWKRLFEDCNKKQGEEIECLRRDYKERSERLALTTAVEKRDTCKEYSSWAVPDGALDASRNESNDTNVTHNCSWSSDNPGPE